MDKTVECGLCGFTAPYLVPHLLEAHGLSEAEYDGETVSPALEALHETTCKGRKRTPAKRAGVGLTTKFAGLDLPVDVRVPASACLPMPPGYAVPKHGKLSDAVRRVAVRLGGGRQKPLWVWGSPGTGKDAVFAALSAATRRPTLVLNISPDVDVQAWLCARAFSPTGTYWEEGFLLKALREGYTTPSGERVPYLIVLSDLDRASRSQLEPLRAICESDGGRIVALNGVHQVLPGTMIVATANTSGGGDTSGKYTSTTVDLSILSRFTYKVRFHTMDARDEEPILRAKYPALCARFPDLVGIVLRATTAIRDAIQKEEIFLEFGHRDVCNWMDATQAEAQYTATKDASRVLREGLQDILAGCPNEDTLEAVKRLVDPHMKGGAVEEGEPPV